MRGLLVLTLMASNLTSFAWAKEVGTYHIDFEGRNKTGGSAVDWGALLLGWTCWTKSSIRFSELLPDHHGRMKLTPRDINQKHSDFNFVTHPHLSAEFDRDMDISKDAARLDTKITEHCSKPFSDKDLYIEWTCPIATLPDANAIKQEAPCDTRMHWVDIGSSSRRHSRSWGEALVKTAIDAAETISLAMLKEKEVTATVALMGKNEFFLKDYCDGATEEEKAHRQVIQIIQGVGGHWGEDDFRFTVQIGNKPPFEFDRRSSVLHEEIAYCGSDDPIEVKISAIERDLIFDDKYVPEKPEGISLSQKLGRTDGTILLRRKTWFMKDYRENEIKVQLKQQ